MSARIGVPLVVLAVAGAWALLARALPLSGPEAPGPAFVPLLLSGILALLGLGLLVGELKRGGRTLGGGLVRADGPARGLRQADGATQASVPAQAAASPGWLAAGRVIGLLAVYIAGVAHVGFLPVTPLYVALTAWQCGARSPRGIAATAVGLTLAVWLVLTRLFRVPLP